MTDYAARLCWNTNGWRAPSGEAARSEGSGTYAAVNGFGHEEWLFRNEWLLDGWRYSFLQPVNDSRAKLLRAAEPFDVRLWAMDGQKFWVGAIENCEILTEAQASWAIEQYSAVGWLERMRKEVEGIEGNAAEIATTVGSQVFNIRFQPEQATLLQPARVMSESDGRALGSRYVLAQRSVAPTLRDGSSAGLTERTLVTAAPLDTRPVVRIVQPGPIETQRVHAELQNQLVEFLTPRSDRCVRHENRVVDVTAEWGGSVWLFEIKTDERAIQCIREAVGQLLEYAWRRKGEGTRPKLVVAGPGEGSDDTNQYLRYLEATWGLSVAYVAVPSGLSQLKLPPKSTG